MNDLIFKLKLKNRVELRSDKIVVFTKFPRGETTKGRKRKSRFTQFVYKQFLFSLENLPKKM